MAHSRKKQQIDGRMEILQNCDRSAVELLLPLFLTFIWDVEQFMKVESASITDRFFRNADDYFKEMYARKKKVVNHLKNFYKIFQV